MFLYVQPGGHRVSSCSRASETTKMNTESSDKYVGILVGGPGGEAGVSLCSGRFVHSFFPKEFANAFFIYMGADHKISLHRDDSFMEGEGNLLQAKKGLSSFPSGALPGQLENFGIPLDQLRGIFPLIHGTFCEDGKFLAYLEVLGIPFAGCSSVTSMHCFDKVLTKLSLLSSGVDVVPFIWGISPEMLLGHPFSPQPVFVKPARQGSSLGVKRATGEDDYKSALEYAFEFDTKVLVEPEIPGRELEVALLETPDGWVVSQAGEIDSGKSGFYSFEAKYETQSDAKTSIAELSAPLEMELQEQALEAAALLDLRGFARIDFFLDANEKLWLNEINTLPGFTGISMFPYLMEDSGFEPAELIRVILEGMES